MECCKKKKLKRRWELRINAARDYFRGGGGVMFNNTYLVRTVSFNGSGNFTNLPRVASYE